MLELRGTIKSVDTEYLSLCILQFMKVRKGQGPEVFLGVAQQSWSDASLINVKAYVRAGVRDDLILDKGEVWQAIYLGSVVSHSRMHTACIALAQGTATPLLSSVVHAAANQPYPTVSTVFQGLNASQARAVNTFLHPDSSLVLLQGPPGTGKTTTIVALLKRLLATGTRTLVCAPSNKAVEVLAARLFKDCPTAKVVLVGVDSKISPQLEGVSLSAMARRYRKSLMEAASCIRQDVEETVPAPAPETLHARLRSALQHLSAADSLLQRWDLAEPKIYAAREAIELLVQVCPAGPISLASLQSHVGALRSLEYPETEVLIAATVVFSTLCVSGRKQMLEMNPVTALVVDEAAQSVEAETLIAMQHRPSKLLLVGDTKQLPATVISQRAILNHYHWSMMYRLADLCRMPMLMLEEQYRMHPEISQWPSQRYYGGLLRDGASIPDRPRPAGFPEWMQPVAFYDPSGPGNKEKKKGTSTVNDKEARYVAQVLKKIRASDPTGTVGIIVPYSAQVDAVEAELKRLKVGSKHTRVSSVDGFQGDECDYILLSFLRCEGSAGFTGDAQRLNVAITRAKHGLFILGSRSTLSKQAELKALFSHLQDKGRLYKEDQLKSLLGVIDPVDDLTDQLAGLKVGGKATKVKGSKTKLKAGAATATTTASTTSSSNSTAAVEDTTAAPPEPATTPADNVISAAMEVRVRR